MYKLIALDLDDTLLGHDASISPEHREAIQAARGRGCEVTLVTARSWRATRRYAEELELTLPVICMTGAAVYSPAGEVLWTNPIALPDARRVAAWADEADWTIRLYYLNGRIVQSRMAEDYFPTAPSHAYPTETLVGAVSPFLEDGEEPIQMALLGNRSVEGVLARLPELPDVVSTTYDRQSTISRTHLMHRSVNKGAALAAYCDRLGFHREAVIAMGDGYPDQPMLQWAGAGVAMGWAPEPVRQAAVLVTDPQDVHPVATALRQLLG